MARSSEDKSTWEYGPWTDEPDVKMWTDEETGLECMAKRGPVGSWCGYVGVPKGSVLAGRSYSKDSYTIEEVMNGSAAEDARVQARVNDITVHGGLTFAGDWGEGGLYWFGFDCSHAGDFSPRVDRPVDDPVLGLGRPTGWGKVIEYRDLKYVEGQVMDLARQLLAILREAGQ